MLNADIKKILLRLAIVAFFVAVLVLGLCAYKDYGISTDEPIQRRHGLVNYRYVNETVFGRDMSKMDNIWVISDNSSLPNLEKYQNKYYGVAIQMPLVFIEDLADFTMTTQQIYFMRHLYNFLIFFIALICFFFLCKDLLKSESWAFVGTVMLLLCPRFFAESFYNIKDLMFVSLLIIALFFMVKMLLNKRKTLWCVFFAITCAFATNSRVIGIMLAAAVIMVMFLEDIVGHFTNNKEIKFLLPKNEEKSMGLRICGFLRPYIIFCLAYVFFYILISPASWRDPFEFIKNTLVSFADYQPWQGKMLFGGQLITKEQLPWYYILGWMGMTIPIFHLLMFFIGTCSLICNTIKGKFIKFVEIRYVWVVFLLFLIPLLGFIIFNLKIYLGWRHVYFLAPPLLLVAVFGAKSLHEKLQMHIKKVRKYIVPGLMGAVFACIAVWMIIAHPYQNVYFNAVGRTVATKFDRDYWRLASADMLRYLLNTYTDSINVCSSMDIAMMKNILSPEQQARINVVDTCEEADFVLDNFRYTVGNDYEVKGYSEDYSIYVDGFKIGTVLKNKEYTE